jgi:hypothetical protein
MAVVLNWESPATSWLFRLDSLGYIVWQQRYAIDSTQFSSPAILSLIPTSDNCYLLSGYAWSPDSIYPGSNIRKVLLIKVNDSGNIVFESPWGLSNGICSDGQKSIEDISHQIYTAGRRTRFTSPLGDSPCMFTTNFVGNPISYQDLKVNSTYGIATTINWLQDSTLVFCSDWAFSNNIDSTGVVKVSRNGSFLDSKVLLANQISGFRGSAITFDNKLLLGGELKMNNGYYNACAFKLNSNLDFDSIYNQPFTYDSLCPHPIISDTTNLDNCSLVTSVFNPSNDYEDTKLKVYPNPTSGNLNFIFPKYLLQKYSTQGINISKIEYQWESTILEAFSSEGTKVFNKTIKKEDEKLAMDISSWPKGIYYFRLMFKNNCISGEKVILK